MAGRSRAGSSPRRARTDSVDELSSFFRLLANELSESTDDIIANMRQDEITVEDLAHMTKKDLYDYGVQTFRDAKLILERARSYGRAGSRPVKQGSASQGEQHPPRLVRQASSRDYDGSLKVKLMDVRPGVRDVFAAQLDGNVEGVSNWEQFGEKLLNMDAVDLRQFKSTPSPTKAIINKKVAVDPSATLEDAFEALEDIGRKDVTMLVIQQLESRNPTPSRDGSIERSSPPNQSSLLVDQRVHHIMDPPTHLDGGVAAQNHTYFNQEPEQKMEVVTTQSPSPPSQNSPEKKVPSSSISQPSQTPEDKDLYSLLKDMTIDEQHQTINITCKVYNASTNQLIKGEAPAPLLRDIKRFQNFPASSVPIGTRVRLEVTTDSPCYLYIFNLGTSGSNTMLFPSEDEKDNFFRPNQAYHFPGYDSYFEIGPPAGQEVVQVMAFSRKPDFLTPRQNAPLLRDIHLLNNASQNEGRGFARVEFIVVVH